MSSNIRDELVKTAGLSPARTEDEAAFLRRLVDHISKQISEEAWGALSPEAQDWNNDAADAASAQQAFPPFPDEVSEAAPATSTRRRGASSPTPEPAKYEPKNGDEVKITTKRGKESTGIIVALDVKEGTVTINPLGEKGAEKDDVKFDIDAVTIVPAAQVALPLESTAEAEGPRDPAVGDTVQVTAGRGKVIMGKVTELGDDLLVLVDAAGAEVEVVPSTCKQIEIKAGAAPTSSRRGAATNPPPAPATSRRGATTPATGSDAKPTRASNAGGVSVGQRVNELVVDNPGWTEEQVGAQLKKEGIEFKDNTLDMCFKSAQRFMAILRDRKIIK